jgi:hypothetical protein
MWQPQSAKANPAKKDLLEEGGAIGLAALISLHRHYHGRAPVVN